MMCSRFKNMEIDISMALDSVFSFLCGYLMSRFTIFFATDFFPHMDRAEVLDVASTAFITAGLLALISVVAGFEPGSNLLFPVIIIAISAFLPAYGTYLAVSGVSIPIASLIAFVILCLGAFVPSHMAGGASIMGAIAGSIAAGYKCGTRDIGFSLFCGILTGFFAAVIETIGLFFIFALFFSLLNGATGLSRFII